MKESYMDGDINIIKIVHIGYDNFISSDEV